MQIIPEDSREESKDMTTMDYGESKSRDSSALNKSILPGLGLGDAGSPRSSQVNSVVGFFENGPPNQSLLSKAVMRMDRAPSSNSNNAKVAQVHLKLDPTSKEIIDITEAKRAELKSKQSKLNKSKHM